MQPISVSNLRGSQNSLKSREVAIRSIAASQRGCQPYENVREIRVPRRLSGLSVSDFFAKYQPSIRADEWTVWLEAGDITFGHGSLKGSVLQQTHVAREGEIYLHRLPEFTEPPINPDIQLLHEDASLIVVDKPSPLPTVPSGRFNRNSLLAILAEAYNASDLRVAHRLDANTSGVIVVCRTAAAASLVQPQFAQKSVQKTYIARVHGSPTWDSYECSLPIDNRVGLAGARNSSVTGLTAETRFKTLERFADGTTLLEATPITGRTNQIRVHLQQLDFPIVNDPMYQRSGQVSCNQTLSPNAPPMCLHASRIRLTHPDTSVQVTYTATSPSWTSSPLT